jgi:hypothetical protein
VVRHGFDSATWAVAKKEMRGILIEVATRDQPTISYSDLVLELKTIRFSRDSREFYLMLDEISEEEDQAGRGMLSALVVHKHDDQIPGKGFFDLAKKLGRKVSNKDQCWVEELNRVCSYWKTSP